MKIHYFVYGLLGFIAISTFILLFFPYRWLGNRILPCVHHLHQADVIVVLFGDGNAQGTGVGRETRRRISYGISLLQAGYAPSILFSGGHPDGANLMAERAQQSGVDSEVIFIENMSRDTFSNWENTAQIAETHGWTSVLLVSSVFHVARALLILEPGTLTLHPAAIPYDISEPHYTHRDLTKSFVHNTGAYLLYKMSGEHLYARIVSYLRD